MELSSQSQQEERIPTTGFRWRGSRMGRGDAVSSECLGLGPAVVGMGSSQAGAAGHRLMSVTSVGVLVGWLAG